MLVDDDILFSDLKLDPDTFYFLYIGEIKTDCLNQFFKETLSKIHGRQFDFISILPDGNRKLSRNLLDNLQMLIIEKVVISCQKVQGAYQFTLEYKRCTDA